MVMDRESLWSANVWRQMIVNGECYGLWTVNDYGQVTIIQHSQK